MPASEYSHRTHFSRGRWSAAGRSRRRTRGGFSACVHHCVLPQVSQVRKTAPLCHSPASVPTFAAVHMAHGRSTSKLSTIDGGSPRMNAGTDSLSRRGFLFDLRALYFSQRT
jgi:hypothetical protein